MLRTQIQDHQVPTKQIITKHIQTGGLLLLSFSSSGKKRAWNGGQKQIKIQAHRLYMGIEDIF